MRRAWQLLVVAACLLLTLSYASAHELRPGYLEVLETAASEYRVRWKAPVSKGRPLAVEPGFPSTCETHGGASRSSAGGMLSSEGTLRCERSLAGRRIDLKGLDATLTDVLVRVISSDGRSQTLRATPDAPIVQWPAELSTRGVMRTYFVLGVEHILSGWDHLLFVLALVLLISGVRRLIETITAFTLAHSITLLAASLGWVTLPSAPVEAVIALSIVFLANEVANKRRGVRRMSQRRPWVVAFVFGLLHGFGFAGALASIGLPRNDIPVALLSFNLGVEAGQLMFLAGVLLVLGLLTRLNWRQAFDRLASYGIGITASFWLLQRVI